MEGVFLPKTEIPADSTLTPQVQLRKLMLIRIIFEPMLGVPQYVYFQCVVLQLLT